MKRTLKWCCGILLSFTLSTAVYAISNYGPTNIQFGNGVKYTLSNAIKSTNVLYPSVNWTYSSVYGLPVYYGAIMTQTGTPATEGYKPLLPGQEMNLYSYYYHLRAPQLPVSLRAYVADITADITVAGTWNPDAGMVPY